MSLVIGATITAILNGIITVPLFDPDYTVTYTHSWNVGFCPFSIYPLISSRTLSTSNSAVRTCVEAYTIGPFGYGYTVGNSRLLAGASSSTSSEFMSLYGNILFTGCTGVYSVTGYTSFNVLPAGIGIGDVPASFSRSISSNPFSNVSTKIASVNNVGLLNTDTGPAFLVMHFDGNDDSYATYFNVAGLAQGNPILLYTGGDYSPSSGSIVPNRNGYGTNFGMNIASIQSIASVATLTKNSFSGTGVLTYNPIQFDETSVNDVFTPLTGFTSHMQSTSFGHLISIGGGGLFTGQSANALLLAPDCSSYSLIRFAPQSTNTSNLISSALLNESVMTIGPDGTFYFINEASPGYIANSFALNLSYQPVQAPTLNQPSFTIPGLCGCCYPPSFGSVGSEGH